MAAENMVEYDPSHLYKQVEIMFNNVPVTLNVPINTKWVIRERNKLYVTNYAHEPKKVAGCYNIHNGEWVDYEHYENYNSFRLKTYLGKVSVEMEFETRCESWMI